MAVDVSSINKTLGSAFMGGDIGGLTGGGGGGVAVEPSYDLAARMGYLGGSSPVQKDDDEYFKAMASLRDSDMGFAYLPSLVLFGDKIQEGKTIFDNTKAIEPVKEPVEKIDGHKDEKKDASPFHQLEVLMGGNAAAVNYALSLLTGDNLDKNLEMLKKNLVVPQSVIDKIRDSIQQTDEKLLTPSGPGEYEKFRQGEKSAGQGVLGKREGQPPPGGISNMGKIVASLGSISGGASQIQSIIGQVKNKLESAVPTLTGKLFDDLALNIDPFVQNILNGLIGSVLDDSKGRLEILKAIANGNLDRAAQLILELSAVEGMTIEKITAALEVIETDVSKYVQTGKYEPDVETDLSREDNNDSYVETAEEFEAEISSSPRPINGVVLHTSSKADPRSNIDPTLLEETLKQSFHYIMQPNGRIYRSSGLGKIMGGLAGNAAGLIHILVAKADDNPNNFLSIDQGKSYREMVKVFHRLIPGVQIANFSELSDASTTPIVGMNPGAVQCGITGLNNLGTGPASNYQPGIRTGAEPPSKNAQSYGGRTTTGKMKHQLDPRCGAVNGILTSVGDALGIQVRVSSGFRGSGGSGRHNGRASDCYLVRDGVIMSAMRADQRPYVIKFTDEFLKAGGRGVGCANHATGGKKYMGGDHYHYDVVGNRRGGVDFWGDRQTKHNGGAPVWLWNLARSHGYRG